MCFKRNLLRTIFVTNILTEKKKKKKTFRKSFQTLGIFVALDEYYISVAFHKEGSAIHMATPSSYFNEEMTNVHGLGFLNLTIHRTFQLKPNLQTGFFK